MLRSTIALWLVALAAAAAALAGPSPHMRDLCKDGGFMSVVGQPPDNPDRVMFRNQGQCVSFANHGGRLVGIDDPNA